MMHVQTGKVSRAASVLDVVKECFTTGMGSFERVEGRIAAALQDILAQPGSLVRAGVTYGVAVEMEVAEDAAQAMACGIEYLHTASLVFDDLPAMDDAKTRRGVACVHRVHGEATAMLAALAMVNSGYGLLWKSLHAASAERRRAAGILVEKRLGLHGVIGGQAYDLQDGAGLRSGVSVSEIAARKTADLLRLALVLPAVVGQGTAREVQILDRLAILRGLAYQAANDVKDVMSHPDEVGKPVGRDALLGRPNLALAKGLAAAVMRHRRLCEMGDRVQASLPGTVERWEFLELLKVPLPVVIHEGEVARQEAVI